MTYDNVEDRRKQVRRWEKKNPEKKKSMATRYRQKHRYSLRYRQHLSRLEEKKQTLALYAKDDKIACIICGEDDIDMLTLDHINNDGAEHRLLMSNNNGQKFYRYLRKSEYKDLQILCWNHNIKKERLRKREILRMAAEAEEKSNQSTESKTSDSPMVTGSVKRGRVYA